MKIDLRARDLSTPEKRLEVFCEVFGKLNLSLSPMLVQETMKGMQKEQLSESEFEDYMAKLASDSPSESG